MKDFAVVVHVGKLNIQVDAGMAQFPAVLHVHAHERRDMECFCMGKAKRVGGAGSVPLPKRVAMALIPRRVADFCDNEFDSFVVLVMDVEQVEGTEIVTEAAQLGQ